MLAVFRKRKASHIGLFLAASIVLLSGGGHTIAQSLKLQIAQIDTYSAQVDRFIKQNPKTLRIFADISGVDQTSPQWREFRSEKDREKASTGDNLNENAYVWKGSGRVVGANFTFQSPSGDWAHLIMYYFREDGSLAKIDAQLNSFYGEVSVIRIRHYSERGGLLKSSSRHLDLQTRKPKKPDADFIDQPIPVYRNVSALPFHKLL